MKVKLTADKSIRGEPRKAGDTIEVSKCVAEWLIERKAAEKIVAKKKSDS